MIRTAVPGDFDEVNAVMDKWWERPIRSILPRLFLDHFCHSSLVARDVDHDELAGFLIGFESPAQSRESYIHAAAVAPPHRRSGLGRELYRRFLRASAAAGRPLVHAITSPANERSIVFHRRLGFAVSDPVRDYEGPGQDMVVFEINVTDSLLNDR